RIGDRLGGLPLGADEEHASASAHNVADLDERLVQERHRLGKIDDVDIVACPEDEGRHFWVPAVALVAEVTASLEQLPHVEGGKRHCVANPFSGFASAGPETAPAVASAKAGPPERQTELVIRLSRRNPRVGWRSCTGCGEDWQGAAKRAA